MYVLVLQALKAYSGFKALLDPVLKSIKSQSSFSEGKCAKQAEGVAGPLKIKCPKICNQR